MQVVAVSGASKRHSNTRIRRGTAGGQNGSVVSLETCSLLDDRYNDEDEDSNDENNQYPINDHHNSAETVVNFDCEQEENTCAKRPAGVYSNQNSSSLNCTNSIHSRKRLIRMYSQHNQQNRIVARLDDSKVNKRVRGSLSVDYCSSSGPTGKVARQQQQQHSAPSCSKYGQRNYLTLQSNSLSAYGVTDVGFSSSALLQRNHHQPSGERSISRSIHVSTSSPSGFPHLNNDERADSTSCSTAFTNGGGHENNCEPCSVSSHSNSSSGGTHIEKKRLASSKGKNISHEYYDEDVEYWHLLDGDLSPSHSTPSCSTPSSIRHLHQRVSSETVVTRNHSSLPMMANRAESESRLTQVSGDPPSYTVATAMPSMDNGHHVTPMSRNCSASFSASRSSLRYRTRSPSGAMIPRRHSGAANSFMTTGRITPLPLQRKTSQLQPHQKISTCSLTVVSPNTVSRSPSQQWNRNSTGNCAAMMPIPQQSNVANQPSPVQPNQHLESSTTTMNPVIDHRNVNVNPLPGAVTSAQPNPLYNVSNEFMRVAGYSQQFRSLLSKRDPSTKKQTGDGVTFASDTKDKDVEKGTSTTPNGDKFLVTNELNDHATLAAAAIALGGAPVSPGPDGTKDSDVDKRVPNPNRPSRKSAYGRLWKEQPNLKHRLKMRKTLFSQRTKVSDFALIFALCGIILTILEAELTASGVISKTEYASYLLRSLIVATTVILIALVIFYHAIETKISVIDSGAEDWRVAITYDRIYQCALEVVICSICPFPYNVNVTWDRLKSDHRTPYSVSLPLDAVLSVPLFLRFYLFGRFMALHSRQFQDAATRSIAALNHIAVNFTFVLKTLMHEHPLRVLILFTVAFWIAMSWILTQCERYVPADKLPEDMTENNHYLNSIWFIIITFMSIGYGDIVPNTYCGRALAITTGIVGAGVSSALIAVISRKLELSRAEKHVNQFMTDSKLTRQRKEAAAAVLQHTWFIHKYKNLPKSKDDMKLRMHQRRFLSAINEFRRVKWDQRKLAEQGNALVDVAKLQSDMHETLWDMQQNQDHLVSQMNTLMQKVQELQDIIMAQNTISTQPPPQTIFVQPVAAAPVQQPGQYSQQMSRKSANQHFMTRQMTYPNYASSHPPMMSSTAPVITPIVIAQHVETFPGSPTNNASFDDDLGEQTVIL